MQTVCFASDFDPVFELVMHAGSIVVRLAPTPASVCVHVCVEVHCHMCVTVCVMLQIHNNKSRGLYAY